MVGSPIYKESNVTITTSSGIHGATICEWVVMTLLAENHNFKKLMEWQRAHRWEGIVDLGFPRDLAGQRMGVLGSVRLRPFSLSC